MRLHLALSACVVSLVAQSQIDFFISDTIDWFTDTVAVPDQGRWRIVDIGDLNNDGRNDLAAITGEGPFVGGHDYYLRILFQNLGGGFRAPESYSFPEGHFSSIEIADLNNDDLNDVVFGFQDSLAIYYQNVTGGRLLYESHYVSGSVGSLGCGDLNNDGLNDIAVTYHGRSGITILYQLNSGGFSSQAYDSPYGHCDEVKVADVNADGLLDVVQLIRSDTNSVSIHFQNNNGWLNGVETFPIPRGPFSKYADLGIGDFNFDGFLDICLSRVGLDDAGILIWQYNPVTNALENAPMEMLVDGFPEPIVAIDVNDDGRDEVITVVHTISGNLERKLVVMQSTGKRLVKAFEIEIPFGGSLLPDGMELTDFTRDGKPDIAIADPAYGLVLLKNLSVRGVVDTLPIPQQIKLYPNPTNSHVTVDLPPPYNAVGTQFILIDTFGKILSNKRFIDEANRRELDLSIYPSAVYMLRIQSSSGATHIERIVKVN